MKVGAASTLALPMTIGAAVGAPIGAVVGAKVGAVKGAIVGKALLVKKAALLYKGTKLAAKAIKKPFVLMYKTTKKLVALPAKLAAKVVSYAKPEVGISTFPLAKASLIPLKLPLVVPVPLVVPKGPKSLEASYKVVHPWVGKKFGKLELTSAS